MNYTPAAFFFQAFGEDIEREEGFWLFAPGAARNQLTGKARICYNDSRKNDLSEMGFTGMSDVFFHFFNRESNGRVYEAEPAKKSRRARGSGVSRVLISLAVTAVFGAVYFYFELLTTH